MSSAAPPLLALASTVALATSVAGADPAPPVAALPDGVQVVWDIARAYRETTPTRERICLNGLWRWQPASDAITASAVPDGRWGHFKVPGCWPGITSYLQKDSQTVHPHPAWVQTNLRDLGAAWYQREFSVPAEWAGRRIALAIEYLNSYAAVYVDGRKVGEIRFPGGEVDLDGSCHPGARHVLSLLVVALPLNDVMRSYSDTAAPRDRRGVVERRGLCGDVFLVSTPRAARLGEVRIETSVRRWEITVEAAIDGLEPAATCSLLTRVTEHGQPIQEFQSDAVRVDQIRSGRISLTRAWRPGKLWDVHTPLNQYALQVSLCDAAGTVLDTLPPIRFGFREFWIEGRDFFLNDRRIFLSAVPLDNAQVSAAAITYAAVCESLDRLASLGINFVYTHNYGCEPGAHLAFTDLLRAGV